MASKKNSIVAKASVSTLEKAGVETKLTKMEIADYIAEKAKEELENRQNVLNDLIRDYKNSGIAVNMTKQQKVAADALKVVTGKDIHVVALYRNSGWIGWFASKNNENDFYQYSHFAQFNLEPNQIPDIDVNALVTEQRDNWNRIHNLDKKSHRTLLVEQILSGSESGKKVLSDLAVMINRAVNGS